MPETPKCPKCGSTDTIKAGTDVRKGGRRVQKWRCKGDDCGHVFAEGGAHSVKVKRLGCVFPCPKCGSANTHKHGLRKDDKMGLVRRQECSDCGEKFDRSEGKALTEGSK